MSDIFISYAREDRDKARALAELFQQQDWSVWWDRNIPPGRSFDEVIEEALGAAKCVVVLWSKNSASSDWVKGEAAEGLRRKVLVPVRIDSANVPLEFRRLQTVDLSDWKGDAGHPELGGFLEAVAANTKSVVQRPPKEGSQRKLVKPVLTVLAIVALLAAGLAFYKFARREGGRGSRAVTSAIPQNASPAGEELLGKRIYFETGSAAGVSYSKKLREALQEKGFGVQLPKNGSGGALGYSEVKYDFPEDFSGAAQLIRTLRDLGVENLRPEPRQVLGPKDARHGHFDVWLDPPHMGQDTKR